MIRWMQTFGIISFLFTVICMFLLFQNLLLLAIYAFEASLISLLISLGVSLIEIQISTKALHLELSDMEQ